MGTNSNGGMDVNFLRCALQYLNASMNLLDGELESLMSEIFTHLEIFLAIRQSRLLGLSLTMFDQVQTSQ